MSWLSSFRQRENAMTPQERQLVTELFDRLARLESTPRDAEAERAIADGLRRAPHAVYALVQTALVQDEALKRADARIRELGGDDDAPSAGGFLDTMRNALGGRGSVPSIGASANDRRWNTGGALSQAAQQTGPGATPAPGTGGGSFLGTAAATAAGVIGGSLLFNSIGSLFGGHHTGSAFGSTRGSEDSHSPWDTKETSGDLARDAGVNDIGADPGAGLFDAGYDDSGGDFGGGDFGGGD
jgi:hypothetical protein